MALFADSSDLTMPEGVVPPGDLTRVMQAATDRLLATVLVQAIYETDTSGNPVDTVVADYFKRAACAQAEWMIETGDESGAASMLTGASLSGGPSWSGAIPRVAPNAVDIIRSAVDSTDTPVLTGAYSPGF